MRMPAIFAAHGAPVLLDDAVWVGELAAWAKALPPPRSILMISAHWEERPTTLGATSTVPLVYDFYGFPEKYYRTRYAPPGAPELAARVRGLLSSAGIDCADDPERGLDHGAYVPLGAACRGANFTILTECTSPPRGTACGRRRSRRSGGVCETRSPPRFRPAGDPPEVKSGISGVARFRRARLKLEAARRTAGSRSAPGGR